MYMNQANRDKLRKTMDLAFACVPEGTYFGIDEDRLTMQGRTREAVRSLRRSFPAATWAKKYTGFGGEGSWSYSATIDGVEVLIYACKEAPPTCRLITEEYEAVEEVPIVVGYTTQTVTRTRTRVECDEPVHAG